MVLLRGIARLLLMPGQRAGKLPAHAAHRHMPIFIWTSKFFSKCTTYVTIVSLSSDVHTIIDIGSPCALIPDQSDTWTNTRGAYNPSLDTWFELPQHKMVKILTDREVFPVRLAFTALVLALLSIIHKSGGIFQLQIKSVGCFTSVPTTFFHFTVFCTK